MKRRTWKSIVRRGALALAALLVIAPAAQARVADSFVAPQAAPAVPVHDSHDGVIMRGQGDNVTAVRALSGTVASVSVHDTYSPVPPASGIDYTSSGYRHALPQDLKGTPVAVTAQAPADSFDWTAAGIGAGAAMAALLLLALAWRSRQVMGGRLARV